MTVDSDHIAEVRHLSMEEVRRFARRRGLDADAHIPSFVGRVP